MGNSTTETAIRFLLALRRPDLAGLLSASAVEVGSTIKTLVVIVRAPQPFVEALAILPDNDRRRIAEAAVSGRVSAQVPPDIIVRVSGDPVAGPAALLPNLLIHREMMIGVSTGGTQIQDVDDYYGARQAGIQEVCTALGIRYENPHVSLWDWYRYWKEHFGTYAERRDYVRRLFTDPIAAASGRAINPSPVAEREPTGWERVDRALGRARTQLAAATTEEDSQTVGLICREVLISLAQAVYDPAVHKPEDGVTPSKTDAYRMTEAYIRQALPGESHKELRKLIKAALDLALNLQHRRTADRQLAALCLEGTSSTVALISIIAGRTGLTS